MNSYEYAGSDMFTMMGNFALAGELKADIAKIHFANVDSPEVITVAEISEQRLT